MEDLISPHLPFQIEEQPPYLQVDRVRLLERVLENNSNETYECIRNLNITFELMCKKSPRATPLSVKQLYSEHGEKSIPCLSYVVLGQIFDKESVLSDIKRVTTVQQFPIDRRKTTSIETQTQSFPRQYHLSFFSGSEEGEELWITYLFKIQPNTKVILKKLGTYAYTKDKSISDYFRLKQ
jgi:hypothetical protein